MKINKGTIKNIVLSMSVGVLTLLGASMYYNGKIEDVHNEYRVQIEKAEYDKNKLQMEIDSYKYLAEQSENEVNVQKAKFEEKNNELENLKQQIALSKQQEQRFSRGGDYEHKDLTTYAIMTIDEMNTWIKDRAPNNSPFIGNGELFLRAGNETGLDPKYILAHAALESTWGTSDIARDKNNYFGIQAYNDSAHSSAKSFSSLEDGIIEGAKWIKEFYTDQGQNTLNSMIWGKKAYCQEDDGTPSQSWIDKIVSIIR